MRKVLLALGCLMVFGFPRMGRTEELFGEFQRLPDQIERGFSVGFDFGLLFFVENDTGGSRSAKNPGFQLTFTTGYDLFKYLSIEGVYSIGINEASTSDFVLQGGVNTFLFDLAAKAEWPLGRFYPFFEIGPGIHYSDPEFLPGENYKMNILMGAGIEYYTYLRHFSLFAKTTYYYIMDIPVDTINIGAGMKYTF